MIRYKVTLTKNERSELETILKKGKHSPLEFRNACILLNSDEGDFEAHLIALSCNKAPEGYARWSLRLLADKMVELKYVDSISHETIRRTLKKTKSNRGEFKAG